VIKKNTRRLAKSQRTWFKTFKDVNWLDVEAQEPLERIVARTQTLLEESG
jgi:tRNA A37 N6-isopentenylltransferase MiaA